MQEKLGLFSPAIECGLHPTRQGVTLLFLALACASG